MEDEYYSTLYLAAIFLFSSEATLQLLMSVRPYVRFWGKRNFLGPKFSQSFATYECFHPCFNKRHYKILFSWTIKKMTYILYRLTLFVEMFRYYQFVRINHPPPLHPVRACSVQLTQFWINMFLLFVQIEIKFMTFFCVFFSFQSVFLVCYLFLNFGSVRLSVPNGKL